MPSYETLDAIADGYNPLLALTVALLLLLHLLRREWRDAGVTLLAFCTVALVSYGLMFLDRALNIWPSFGLDYSTHTAEALGLVTVLCLEMPKTRLPLLLSLFAYLLLMLYQHYHTVADIVTTIAVIGAPLVFPLNQLYVRRAGATSR